METSHRWPDAYDRSWTRSHVCVAPLCQLMATLLANEFVPQISLDEDYLNGMTCTLQIGRLQVGARVYACRHDAASGKRHTTSTSLPSVAPPLSSYPLAEVTKFLPRSGSLKKQWQSSLRSLSDARCLLPAARCPLPGPTEERPVFEKPERTPLHFPPSARGKWNCLRRVAT